MAMPEDKLRFLVRPMSEGRLEARCESPLIVVEAARLSEIRAQVETAVRAAFGERRPFALMVGTPPEDDLARRRYARAAG
jgi:hypothetical protein